jgi:hypothetical protein
MDIVRRSAEKNSPLWSRGKFGRPDCSRISAMSDDHHRIRRANSSAQQRNQAALLFARRGVRCEPPPPPPTGLIIAGDRILFKFCLMSR